MTEEQNIPELIETAMTKFDLNQTELARELGIKPSYISKLRHGVRLKLGGQYIERLYTLIARGPVTSDRAGIAEIAPNYSQSTRDQSLLGRVGEIPSVETAEGLTARYVPIISWQTASQLQDPAERAYQQSSAHLAFNVTDPRAIAVPIRGDSMMPKYEDGDVLILYPSSPPSNGDPVLARLREHAGGDLMFKIFTQQGTKVVLSSYNPVYPNMEFERDDFLWIYPAASVVKHIRK